MKNCLIAVLFALLTLIITPVALADQDDSSGTFIEMTLVDTCEQAGDQCVTVTWLTEPVPWGEPGTEVTCRTALVATVYNGKEKPAHFKLCDYPSPNEQSRYRQRHLEKVAIELHEIGVTESPEALLRRSIQIIENGP
jgi:hypothetical protein